MSLLDDFLSSLPQLHATSTRFLLTILWIFSPLLAANDQPSRGTLIHEFGRIMTLQVIQPSGLDRSQIPLLLLAKHSFSAASLWAFKAALVDTLRVSLCLSNDSSGLLGDQIIQVGNGMHNSILVFLLNAFEEGGGCRSILFLKGTSKSPIGITWGNFDLSHGGRKQSKSHNLAQKIYPQALASRKLKLRCHNARLDFSRVNILISKIK